MLGAARDFLAGRLTGGTRGQVTAEPTRRHVVAAAAAGSLLLAGCKGLDALGPPPKPAAAVDTLTRAIAAEEQMVRMYRAALATLAGRSRATSVVSVMLADHQAHLDRLRSRLIVPPGLPQAKPSPSHAPPALPTAQHEVIAALVSAENAAASRLTGQLLTAPPALAQLMASISASEAGHGALLSRPGLA
jgi:hypothetical protein